MSRLFNAACAVIVCGALVPASSNVAGADDTPTVADVLKMRVIEDDLPLVEVREFAEPRIRPMPEVTSVAEWEAQARRMREETLARVMCRGRADEWRKAPLKVEWLDTIEGGKGYRIRKLRYEAVPGLWIPALLYEPETLEGKVPVVMNVNGHDGDGKAAVYKQTRCINLAKRGMLALNVEWLGMGQLKGDNFVHYRLNQLDLCGTSGVGVFYLSMKRGLDVLLGLEHADPNRVAVAGLSGGGWQTIIISALDERVTVANPVAGYSSLKSRVRVPADLGDSEQAPVDLGVTADYAQLTAMRAPRPTLLTYNAKDNCCFLPPGALPPLLAAAEPIYKLYGKADHLRHHVNEDPGTHNFDRDNRQQFYRLLGDFFYTGQSFDSTEIPCAEDVKTKEQLHVPLPDVNADLHSLAVDAMQALPVDPKIPVDAFDPTAEQWRADKRKQLAEIIHARQYTAREISAGTKEFAGGKATLWRLRLDGTWTVPAVELAGTNSSGTVILIADSDRAEGAAEAEAILKVGRRVLAVDPFYFGESHIKERDTLYGLLLSSVGERPLGIQAGQLAAVARWAQSKYGGRRVEIQAVGPRTGLIALVTAALEKDAIGSVGLSGSFGSLKEIIEQNLDVNKGPELFTFGLLEHFDVRQLWAMVQPRAVAFLSPSPRVLQEIPEITDKTVGLVPNRPAVPGKLRVRMQFRGDNKTADGATFVAETREEDWNASETAIIICDMWNGHYCQLAAQRVDAMAPRMNNVVSRARAHGITVIHAPSGCMDVYEDTAFRRRVQQAPQVTPPVELKQWCYLDPAREPELPVDVSKQSCDDPIVAPAVRQFSKQHDAIKIIGYDGVSDNGPEIYNHFMQLGIKNVVLMGVHTNMCVLGRPFGIRQMKYLGFNVVLARDLTDAMYDPREYPYVSHTRGTELVIEHIEKFWCPSILGEDLTSVLPGSNDPSADVLKAGRPSASAEK